MNIRLLGCITLLFSIAQSSAAEPSHEHWKVVKYLDATSISSSSRSLQHVIGEQLLIVDKKIGFGGTSCAIEAVDNLSTNRDAKAYFLKEFKADFDKLSTPTPVSVTATECNTIIRSLGSDARIVVEWNGDFFEAIRSEGSAK